MIDQYNHIYSGCLPGGTLSLLQGILLGEWDDVIWKLSHLVLTPIWTFSCLYPKSPFSWPSNLSSSRFLTSLPSHLPLPMILCLFQAQLWQLLFPSKVDDRVTAQIFAHWISPHSCLPRLAPPTHQANPFVNHPQTFYLPSTNDKRFPVWCGTVVDDVGV